MEFVFAVDPHLLSIDDEMPASIQTMDPAFTRTDSYENFDTIQEDNDSMLCLYFLLLWHIVKD